MLLDKAIVRLESCRVDDELRVVVALVGNLLFNSGSTACLPSNRNVIVSLCP